MRDSYNENDQEARNLIGIANKGFQGHEEQQALTHIRTELDKMVDDQMKSVAFELQKYPDQAKVKFDEGWPISIDFYGKGESMHVPTGIGTENGMDPEPAAVYKLPPDARLQFGKVEFVNSEQNRDPAIEAAILQSGSLKDLDKGEKINYMYDKVDLSGHGSNEVLVYLPDSKLCGTGGCSALVLQKDGDKYRIVSDMTVTQTPIVVAPTATRGWNDLIEYTNGVDPLQVQYRSVQFDGKAYPENPTVQPKLHPGSTVSGTAYLADQQFEKSKLTFEKP
jgi:hypothetical protein